MSSKTNSSPPVKHPYLPKDLLLPHYVPNARNTREILTILACVAVLVIILAWVITGRRKEPFCLMRRVVLCWFMLCAFIHTILEGYFAIYHASLAGHTSILGEMWKEYSHCDSRYLSSDTFTVCMESITALIDGPLAFITFFAFMQGNNYRYALQMILSLFQLYGDTLYFTTAFQDGLKTNSSEPLYFGFYFLFLNLLWIIIPLMLIIDSARHIAACQTVSDFYIDEYNRKHGNLTQNHHKKLR